MSEEAKPTEEHHGIMDAIKDVAHKVVDATILNKHPAGGNIDGAVTLDGKFAQEVVKATVLNDNPCGGNIGEIFSALDDLRSEKSLYS